MVLYKLYYTKVYYRAAGLSLACDGGFALLQLLTSESRNSKPKEVSRKKSYWFLVGNEGMDYGDYYWGLYRDLSERLLGASRGFWALPSHHRPLTFAIAFMPEISSTIVAVALRLASHSMLAFAFGEGTIIFAFLAIAARIGLAIAFGPAPRNLGANGLSSFLPRPSASLPPFLPCPSRAPRLPQRVPP